jgi:Fe-S cluster assembly ATP-binding protein
VDGREVLNDIDLYIDKGETHVLLGPNGSGKSTLFMTILGFPKYKVTRGEIIFKGVDITNYSTTERVREGIGVSFQNPPAIRGIKLKSILQMESMGGIPEDEELTPEMKDLVRKLKFNDQFLERDVNLGFSGGEVKRSEILQLLAQKPDFVMFDEPDSGVDIENVELLAEEINVLLDKTKKPGMREKSGLLITHLGYILNFVEADTAHVLMDGKIACSGNPKEILEDIRKEGFKGCVECCQVH